MLILRSGDVNIQPDTVSDVGSLLINQRFIIGEPPAGASTSRKGWYLQLSDGVELYQCPTEGLGVYEWCTPRLVADDASFENFSLVLTANTGVQIRSPLAPAAAAALAVHLGGDGGPGGESAGGAGGSADGDAGGSSAGDKRKRANGRGSKA